MRKAAVLTALVFALCVPALANMVVNGDWATADETGWTRWQAPWCEGHLDWVVLNDAGADPAHKPYGRAGFSTAWGQNTGKGSMGWYQRISGVTPGKQYRITAEWHGNIYDAGWAEVMFFSAMDTDADAAIVNRIDVGTAADISFKKDSWGMNPPTDFQTWGPCMPFPHPAGNNGLVTASGNQLVVALKVGTGTTNGAWCKWDNLVVEEVPVPEPGSMMVLATGILGLAGAALKRRK